jgi:hypothetical protein
VGVDRILRQQCHRLSRDAWFREPSCMRTCTRSRSGNAITGAERMCHPLIGESHLYPKFSKKVPLSSIRSLLQFPRSRFEGAA